MNEIKNEIKEKKSKSVCFTSIPINSCLKAADDWLGQDLPWYPVNKIQKEYLEKFFEKDSAEYEFVKRIASDKSEEINRFLAENGFPGMQVPEFQKPEFGIASVMDQIVKWLLQGMTTKMQGKDDNIYDAVKFKDLKAFEVYKSSVYPHPIAVLNTKTEDKVYLSFMDVVMDDETQFGFKMMELTQSITNELTKRSKRSIYFEQIIIPKIDFEGDVNIDWINGMQTINPWFIGDAKMKAKLRLNHIGARAQAAVAMVISLGTFPPPPKILKFDRPFMIWFTHKGKVTFVMYVAYDCWKDPGDDIFSEQTEHKEKKSTIFSGLTELEEKRREGEEIRNITIYQLNDQKAEFEQLELDEDAELYKLLGPSLILLLIDQDNNKAWLWKGTEVSTRMKFLSANLAPSIIDQHGMMKIHSVDDGNERLAFKIMIGLD